MSTVAEIEAAISRLPLEQAKEASEWLEHWLEDQRELSPEFVASNQSIRELKIVNPFSQRVGKL